jgi:DNA-binding MarR family transcriptional regulator
MATPTPDDMAAGLQRFGLERDRMRAALASAAGISATDLDALEHLEADGPLTQRQLGDRLSLTSGAITMLIDRLEKGGLVRRQPHPSDRRYVMVELAAREPDLPDALVTYHARVRAIADSVAPAQRGDVLDFLRRAADAALVASAELRAHDVRRP